MKLKPEEINQDYATTDGYEKFKKSNENTKKFTQQLLTGLLHKSESQREIKEAREKLEMDIDEEDETNTKYNSDRNLVKAESNKKVDVKSKSKFTH